MKRVNSEPDLEYFQVKKCKLPEPMMDSSANYLSPPPGLPLKGPGSSNAGEADIELRRVMDNFVNIYEQLGKCNGPNVKPNYSYTELAYLAMLRSPNFCLPITEIYRYIQSRFTFFKNSTRKHWKNAVRHSLAKTLCFTKITVGRGKSSSENLSRSTYLWCIIPSSIASFARGDYRPSADKDSGSNSLRWGYYRVNAGQFWDQVGNYLAAKMVAFKKSLDSSPDPGQIFESQVCQIPESFLLAQNTKPLASLSLLNNVPSDNRPCSIATIPSRVYVSQPVGPPPSYHQRQETRTEPYIQHFKLELYSQPHAKSVYREITSTPEPSRPYALKSPELEILSPESRSRDVLTDRHTPFLNVSDYHDSGNESIGCESSPEENRLFSSCSQQLCTRTPPVLNLALANYSTDKDDLGDIDISPFEIPELSDFSYIDTPQSDLASPRQGLSTNDSGYAVDYSLSYRMDSSRSFTESSCLFATDLKPSMYSAISPPNLRSCVIEQKPQSVAGKVDLFDFENQFVGMSDPLFSQWNCNSSWKL